MRALFVKAHSQVKCVDEVKCYPAFSVRNFSAIIVFTGTNGPVVGKSLGRFPDSARRITDPRRFRKKFNGEDMERFAIYGCGGSGREILPLLRNVLPDGHESDEIVFVSDLDEEIGSVANGVKVLAFDELVSAGHCDRRVIVSLGPPVLRRKLVERCEAAGLQFGSVAASTYKSFDDVSVGEGAVFCDYSMCTTNVRIGRHFQCNYYSYVAHDCIVGDFVTFAPRVNCNGRIVIEDDVFVGSSAVLRQGDPGRPLRIGRGAVIGMGAVVTKDVEPYTTVVGNPARPMAPR